MSRQAVLLTDSRTSRLGMAMRQPVEQAFVKLGWKVYDSHLDVDQDGLAVMAKFDETFALLQPDDLLVVFDFACIRMKSMEEEPMYNNWSFQTIHVLFQRPWDYEEFMIWRTNFNTRFYCMLLEDQELIRIGYPRLVNVYALPAELWSTSPKKWMHGFGKRQEEIESFDERLDKLSPAMQTVARMWQQKMQTEPAQPDVNHLLSCFQELKFDCSVQELLDLLFLLKEVAYIEEAAPKQNLSEVVQPKCLDGIVSEWVDYHYPVSLL